MRDGAAVRRRTGTSNERENHPVGFLLAVGSGGQSRSSAGGHPRVGGVADHWILPELGARAVGEGEGIDGSEFVGELVVALGEVEKCMLALYFEFFF